MTTAADALAGGSSSAAPPNGGGTNGGGSAPGGTNGLPTAPAATGWWDSVKDGDVKGWLATKNYPSAEHALQAHRSLEQLMGADKAGRTVLLPKDDNDAEGWKNLTARLGVPEKPDGYKLPMPSEGGDENFSRTAASWFHAAGVPPRAANAVAEKWNAWVAEQVQSGRAADDAEANKQMEGLKGEWGAKYDENRELAARGFAAFAKQFGLQFDGEPSEAFLRAQSVFGAANLTRLFHGFGSMMSESGFKGLNTAGAFGMSATDAQKQVDQITADRAAGKISDFAWRTEYEPKMLKLGEVIASRSAA